MHFTTTIGNSFHVIEAGLNGRTTSFDEKTIMRPSRNGFATLPVILEMHYPLDLVIFMLGTNDLKIEFNATPEQITQNMSRLISYVGPRVRKLRPAATLS